MGYEMRRKRQKLEDAEAREILERTYEGVLSVIDSQGLPYGVPLNHVLVGDVIYFHSARAGRKVDAVGKGANASFCAIDASDVVPEEFTAYFRSVIAEGTIRIVEDEREKRDALMALGLKANPDMDACLKEVDSGIDRCVMFALDIKELSGKEAIELVRERGR